MAKLTAPFQFEGTLQGLSAYKRWDIDKTILRMAYGPSKERIETDPAFDLTKRNNKEFGGCSTAASYVRNAFHPLKPLCDFNTVPVIGALLRSVQRRDAESEFGRRNVRLSLNPQILEGFSLNRRTFFDSVVRSSVAWVLSKETLSGRVTVPALLRDLNFFPNSSHPYYRVVAVLGAVPDLFFALPKYQPAAGYQPVYPQAVQTEWTPVQSNTGPLALELSLPGSPNTPSFSLVLSLGIAFGTVNSRGDIVQVKRAGCAKVMALA